MKFWLAWNMFFAAFDIAFMLISLSNGLYLWAMLMAACGFYTIKQARMYWDAVFKENS